MSILPKETEIFPDELLSDEVQLANGRHWHLLYTRVRQEKSLGRELLAQHIPFYLPLIGRIHLYRGRKRRAFLPLFTGYLFLYATEEERLRALTTNRVAQVLAVPDTQELVRDLRQIRHLIDADTPLTIEGRLKPGQRVRVREGALAGIEGIVEARTKRTRLLVMVHLLQRGVSVEVDDFLLEQID